MDVMDATFSHAQLLDYRRAVAAMYAAVRDPQVDIGERCRRFRIERDHLFRTHPQSALTAEQKARFKGLQHYDFNPAYRFLLPVDTRVEPKVFEIDLQADGLTRMQRFGKIHFSVEEQSVVLSLFWIMGYGGGIFLPFRDLTNTRGTYGGGRYLLDTIKHADLGQVGDWLVIDFNFAYNPSCAYNEHWHCPLAPYENWLPVSIPAGEKQFEDEE
jgi:uncharacterized protein